VAIEYDTGTNFGTVERFFLFTLPVSNNIVRVAEITLYANNANPSASGLPRIDLKKSFSRVWRFVDLACLDRKVIFAPGSPTVVLTVPRPSNRWLTKITAGKESKIWSSCAKNQKDNKNMFEKEKERAKTFLRWFQESYLSSLPPPTKRPKNLPSASVWAFTRWWKAFIEGGNEEESSPGAPERGEGGKW